MLEIPEIKMSWIFLCYLDLFSWLDYLRAVWHIWKDNAVGKDFRICDRELPWGLSAPQISDQSPGVAILGKLWGIRVCVLPKRSLLCAALRAEPKAIITKEHHFQPASPDWRQVPWSPAAKDSAGGSFKFLRAGEEEKKNKVSSSPPLLSKVCLLFHLQSHQRKTPGALQSAKLTTSCSSDEHPCLLPVGGETFTSQTQTSSL